ncbi:hypothetical protein [Noviherbaspirillum sedimenti]|uniref:hypothetical protein n=1 Tax=Noviherbaspirillum sedimenti TaxID=2320865 RepID=UPI0011C3DE9B|nr:hypothetical protein [Noviherbaspirillum sedimenti]
MTYRTTDSLKNSIMWNQLSLFEKTETRAKLFKNSANLINNTPVFLQRDAATGHTGDDKCQPNSTN